MNYLQLAQRLAVELDLPSVPDTLANLDDLTGLTRQLGYWIRQAWVDIQNENAGRWRFLRHKFQLTTTIDDDTYAFGDCKDLSVDASGATAITRFNRWRLTDVYNPPLIAPSATPTRRTPMIYWSWDRFYYTWKATNQSAGKSTTITIDPDDNLVLAPTPNAVFVITGDFYATPQELTADADVPECPSQYHMAIVFKAMLEYAFNDLAQERLAQADKGLARQMGPLMMREAEAYRNFRTAGPLA